MYENDDTEPNEPDDDVDCNHVGLSSARRPNMRGAAPA
jgi:hypothetical protein